jgi:hypothetical protein
MDGCDINDRSLQAFLWFNKKIVRVISVVSVSLTPYISISQASAHSVESVIPLVADVTAITLPTAL